MLSSTHTQDRLKGKKHKTWRKKLYSRDKGICSVCGLDTTGIDSALRYYSKRKLWKDATTFMQLISLQSWSAWHGDHIIPLSQGGTNDLTNCRTVCQWCHTKIHNSTEGV